MGVGNTYFTVYFVTSVFLIHVSLQGEHQRRLYKDLMKNYNPLERPVYNDSHSLTVHFSFSLMQIMDVVVLKGAGKKLSLLGQPCAVCLEEFKARDELGVCPCSHTFHKKCLLKWLEIRSVCPMCNKPIMRLHNPQRGAEGPQDPEEV